jgi:hypothetical protein
MPGEDIQSWSVTAANNGNSDSAIEWREGQTRASVNNSSRSEMAAHAKDRNLKNGSIVTGGSPNAQTFTSGVGYTAPIPTGLRVTLKIGAGLNNSGLTTLNMDGIGDTVVKLDNGNTISGGELVAGCYTDFIFNGTNWIFLYSREFLQTLINGGGGVIIGRQVFATPGTFNYVPTPGTQNIIAETLAGGGGGAGTPNSIYSNGLGGGGGGAGGYSRAYLDIALIGAGVPVVVGAGGVGGALGGGPGGNGQETNFGGGMCVSRAGAGAPASAGLDVEGGAGAIAGIGDVTGTGQAGEPGLAHVQVLSAESGRGGDTAYGSGGPSIITASAVHGNNATGHGGGGGGGASYGGVSATQGGNGAPGLCIVTEFAGRGAPGRDGLPGPAGPIGPVGPAGSGTGDVLVSGTPIANQIAVWTDTSHIKGVDQASLIGFTTGDAKLTLKAVADAGWLMMDDTGIGSAASGAAHPGSQYQALFTLLFNNITDVWCPILTSTGAATTRAAQGSAAAAWAANCRMTLPRQLGRALAVGGAAGAGLTARIVGGYMGEEAHAITTAEMPMHSHAIADPGHTHGVISTQPLVVVGSPAAVAVDEGAFIGAAVFGGSVPANDSTKFTALSSGTGLVNTLGTGGSGAVSLMQPTAFWNVMIKL